jgi:hypothetical protein
MMLVIIRLSLLPYYGVFDESKIVEAEKQPLLGDARPQQ